MALREHRLIVTAKKIGVEFALAHNRAPIRTGRRGDEKQFQSGEMKF